MKPIRILVTGTRDVTPLLERTVCAALEDAFAALSPAQRATAVVVHGAARGADTVAGFWALTSGLTAERHPADWDRHGPGAGPVRNREMVAAGADVCLAFPRPSSAGTWDCVRKAAHAGIPVRIFPVVEA